MKLGISSFTYGWAVGIEGYYPKRRMTFMNLAETARRFGLGLLQIGDNLPLDQIEESELIDLREALHRYGIELELGCRGLSDQTLEDYLNLCSFFSSHLLRIVIDRGQFQPSADEIIETLKRWVPRLEQERVVLAIENHDRLKCKTTVSILQEVHSDQVRVCLDMANSLGCLEGLDEVTKQLIPYTANLHAKDITVKRLPWKLGFQITGTAAGEGMLDLRSVVRQVYRGNPDANCILEQWTPWMGSIEATMETEAASAEKGIENMKKIIADECGSWK